MMTVRRTFRPRALAYALLLAALPARAQEFRAAATFVQINDVYRIDAVENGTVGGLGRVMTVAERARRATGAPVR
ncbi:MAG TPA: hypothetical protein VEQ60_21500, partial [Longimicrobium sp.]|nr:hypothetical protein [Longimicrobium sp.]